MNHPAKETATAASKKNVHYALSESVIYKAEITPTDDGDTKEYVGMTAGSFKNRSLTTKSHSTTHTTRQKRNFRNMFGN